MQILALKVVKSNFCPVKPSQIRVVNVQLRQVFSVVVCKQIDALLMRCFCAAFGSVTAVCVAGSYCGGVGLSRVVAWAVGV